METLRIADQLRRSAHGPAWHGPALSEVLHGVTASHSLQRPCGTAHCIAELALHIAAWARASAAAMDGTAIPQKLPDEWTNVETQTADQWTRTQDLVLAELDRIADKTAGFPDSRLTETVPGRDYDFYFLLHGVVQHTLYHAGQIAVLKRQITASA